MISGAAARTGPPASAGFFLGRAINPAHQNPDLPINFNIKMNLVQELSEALKKMGKRIKVSYF